MEPYLASPMRTRAVFESYQLTAQKRYGQNFLIDASIPEAIVKAAELTGEDFVLEIGPGIGTLTQYLASAARKVVAVEIDRNLLPVLEGTLQFWNNVTVLNADILKVDLEKLVQEENEGRPIKVVANLPYYITTPILMKLLESEAHIESITVMVQEEVAERVQSGPGSKAYGAISLAVQYYAEPKLAVKVPPCCFMPQPGVGSAVLHMKKRLQPAVSPQNPDYMFAAVKAAFLQRRKTLPNALSNYPPLGITREQVAAVLRSMGLSEMARGETLDLQAFAELSDRMLEEKA